mmetsp:Transcript_20007/g.37191  ORF Transcript_20007/g.37191 Transcript_20007/m.37191 type:complete len:359 (-) Transcript_20007:2587-3663(-)
MVILILLAAVACSADRSRHMLDLSVSTSEFSEPDVIKGGEPLAPWNTYGEHKAIDDSSYQEFFIKSDSPHNVTLLSESNDLVGMIPFMFLTIPEPNDREKIHVAQDLSLCSEWESFYLYFNCMRAGSSNISVEISEGFNRSKFMFTKQCYRGGIRQDLEILANGEPVVQDGVVADGWLDGSKKLEGSVTFSLSISSGNQYIESVTVTSQLDVNARGPGAIGGYLTDQTLDVILLVKECRTEKVSLFLKMPPYDILRLTWTNDCELPVVEVEEVVPSLSLQFGDSTFALASNTTFIQSITPQENLVVFTLSSDKPMKFGKPLLTFKHFLLQPELTYAVDSLNDQPTEFSLEFRCFNHGK